MLETSALRFPCRDDQTLVKNTYSLVYLNIFSETVRGLCFSIFLSYTMLVAGKSLLEKMNSTTLNA